MRQEGVRRDQDESLLKEDPRVARRMVSSRDPGRLRYRQERVVDPNEDLEEEVDDDSINEPDDVSVDAE